MFFAVCRDTLSHQGHFKQALGTRPQRDPRSRNHRGVSPPLPPHAGSLSRPPHELHLFARQVKRTLFLLLLLLLLLLLFARFCFMSIVAASYGSTRQPAPVLRRLPKSFGLGCCLPRACVAASAAGELHRNARPAGEEVEGSSWVGRKKGLRLFLLSLCSLVFRHWASKVSVNSRIEVLN